MDKLLRKLYYNPNHPSALGGAHSLFEAANKQLPSITLHDVENWLAAQETFTLHKRRIRKLKTNRYTLLGIDDLWQMDIAEMPKFQESNDGYKYLLFVIDAFSKYLWVTPLKSKSSAAVSKAFTAILDEGRIPIHIMSDKGGEFNNTTVKKHLRKLSINQYVAENPDIKASFA